MPPPRFSVKPPVKLKKANVKKSKDSGAIVRDSSAKRGALEENLSQSVSEPENLQNDPKVNTSRKGSNFAAAIGDKNTKTNKNAASHSADASTGKQSLLSDIESHKSLLTQLCKFSNKELVTRSEIVILNDIVGLYNELNDVEVKLVRNFQGYLDTMGITEEQAESSFDSQLKPSKIEVLLEESGKVIDSTLEKFKRIKLQYPSNP